MGNCCSPAPSSMAWGGEDWDFLKSNDDINNNKKKNTRKKKNTTRPSNKVFDEGQGGLHTSLGNAQKENLLIMGALRGNSSSDSNCNGTTVKIRISKKELKELLGEPSTSGTITDDKKKQQQHDDAEQEMIMENKRVGRASAEQVLLRLLKASRDHEDAQHHRPWKPVLESIPEGN